MLYSPSPLRTVVSILIYVLISHTVLAQDYLLGGSFQYGYVMAHRKTMTHLVTGHSRGFEIDLAAATSGSQAWQRMYAGPQPGIKFIHYDLGNPEFLGTATGAAGYIYLPFFRHDKFTLGGVLGLGVAYLSKRFDTGDLHKNVAIGTHINEILHGQIESQVALSNEFSLKLAFGLTHFSNGAFHIPNLGINVPNLSVGLYHFSKTNRFHAPRDTSFEKRKQIEYNIAAAGGLKEVVRIHGKRYPTYSLTAAAMLPCKFKSSFGMAVNLFYNTSLNYFMTDSAGNKPAAADITRIGIGLNYELHISKLIVILEPGIYVLSHYSGDGLYYQRIGFQYRIGKHWLVQNILKTHFAKADNIELGAGYRW